MGYDILEGIHSMLWYEVHNGLNDIMPAFVTQLSSFIRFRLSMRNWCVEDQEFESLMEVVESIDASYLYHYLHKNYQTAESPQESQVCRQLILSLQERIKFVRPEIRKIYAIVAKYSSTLGASRAGYSKTKDDLYYLILDLEKTVNRQIKLVVLDIEQVKALKEKLSELLGVLDLAEKCIQHEKLRGLYHYVQVVVDSTGYLLLMCLFGEIDDGMAAEMNIQWSDLLQRKSLMPELRDEFRDIYLTVLKSTKPYNWSIEKRIPILGFLISSLREKLKGHMFILKNQIEALHEVLEFVHVFMQEYYFDDFSETNLEPWGDLICVAVSLSGSIRDNALSEDLSTAVNLELCYLVVKYKLVQAQSYLKKLLVSDQVEDLCENLIFELEYLQRFLMNPPEQYNEHKKMRNLLMSIEDAANSARSLSRHLYFNEMGHEVSKEMSLSLSHLLEKIKLVKEDTNDISYIAPKSLFSSFPRMDVIGAKKKESREREMVDAFDYVLSMLDLREIRLLTVPLRDKIQTIKLQMRFLRQFFLCMNDWCIENHEMQFLLEAIKSTINTEDLYQFLCRNELLHCVEPQVNSCISSLQKRIKKIKPKIQKVYDIAIKYSSLSTKSSMLVSELIGSLLHDLNDFLSWQPSLVVPVKEEIEALEKKKRFLGSFLIITNQCMGPENLKKLSTYIKVEVGSTTYFSLMCLVDQMDDNNMIHKITLELSHLLEKISPLKSEVKETCIAILKISKSSPLVIQSKITEFMEALFCSLEESLMELLNNKEKVPLKNQIETLTAMFEILITFLHRSYFEDQTLVDFSTNIGGLASEAENIICSLHDSKISPNFSMENNLEIFHLLVKFKLIKAENAIMELLLRSKSIEMSQVADLSEDLDAELKFLRAFLMVLPKQYIDHDKLNYVLILIEGVASSISSIFQSFNNREMKLEVARSNRLALSGLLVNIKVIKEEARDIYCKTEKASLPNFFEMDIDVIDFVLAKIKEVFTINSDSIAILKHQVEKMQEKLVYQRSVLKDIAEQFNIDEELKILWANIVDIAQKSKYVIVPSFIDKDSPDWYPMLWLSDVREVISLIEAEVRNVCPKVPEPSKSTFPKVGGLGFINFIIGNLEDLLKFKVDSTACVNRVMRALQVKLLFISNTMKEQNEHNELKNLVTSALNLAYKAEYVVDSYVARGDPICYQGVWLSHIVEEFENIEADFSVMNEKGRFGIEIQALNVEETSNFIPSQGSTPTNELVIGFDEEAATIIERLQGGWEQLDIISIIGMPGLGKTTLAKKVYNDGCVTRYFDLRAWCCVSLVYQKRDSLVSLLSQIIEVNDGIGRMQTEDLAIKLWKSLKGKRYLIVLDDIWYIEQWNDLQKYFPDDQIRSRILFTSRDRAVACGANRLNVHELRFLEPSESWELLTKIVFRNGSCPLELQEVGTKIAKDCKGLPLSIVLIAGLLSRTKKQRDWWMQVAERLSSHILGDEDHCKKVLELSYKHLPDHLRSCFLYFGGFVEDEEIQISKLIRLWIAEGFVQEEKMKTPEKVAEGYLMDLVARSLVLVAKRRVDGGVKACRLHDLLHEFCLLKADEENFLKQLNRAGAAADSCSARLLRIHPRDLVELERCGSHVRSLTCLSARVIPIMSDEVSFISNNFKLLRVLDLGCLKLDQSFPIGIEFLIHLRYLSLRGLLKSIPPSIANLWNLETFLVKGLRGEVELPNTIWNLRKLRHLHINDRATFSETLDDSSKLENLVTISTPTLDDGPKTQKILRRLPGLQKLRCIFLDPGNLRSSPCLALNFLNQLQSLKVFYHGQEQRYPCKFNFPSNLTKLILSKFRLPWRDISTIGKLPNLEVLKLLFRAFEGEQWDMNDGEFTKLKFLKLDELDFSQWNASNENLPRLQRLVLSRCKELHEIPSGFGEIPTLEMIEVQWCSRNASISAMKIQEEQDMGDEGLKVLIYPPISST